MRSEYLILGSGISALAVGALLAKAGRSVRVLEAHDAPGGYGHTFAAGGYRFNAQLHYVWNCGPGRSVRRVLDKLGLGAITFESLDPGGFDRMHMPGHQLAIPADMEVLKQRLATSFPAHGRRLAAFCDEVRRTAEELDAVPSPMTVLSALPRLHRLTRVLRYRNATLQSVFDAFDLPLAAQTLLALQWPDFLAPPRRLSFFAWVMLFVGYQRGAYYPTRHFEHVIDSLVGVIRECGGEVLLEHRVDQFVFEGGRVAGVLAERLGERGGSRNEFVRHDGDAIVCNMDPRQAATMIGLERFSRDVRARLDYEYSASNFMAYCVIDGVDLPALGFGKWNTFHTEMEDLNACFDAMLTRGDYSRPSFALTTPSLMTRDRGDCPEGKSIVELLTVADYTRFRHMRFANIKTYNAKKLEIFDELCKVVERSYIPDFRERLCFKMLGSPTTNERYCLSPFGHSYGSDMTPAQIGSRRLGHDSSIANLHFCSASAGFAGFAGAFWTGATLYEALTGDRVLAT